MRTTGSGATFTMGRAARREMILRSALLRAGGRKLEIPLPPEKSQTKEAADNRKLITGGSSEKIAVAQ